MGTRNRSEMVKVLGTPCAILFHNCNSNSNVWFVGQHLLKQKYFRWKMKRQYSTGTACLKTQYSCCSCVKMRAFVTKHFVNVKLN
jgi:hypothetical protein